MDNSTTQRSCVNCAVRFQRNVRQKVLSETAAEVRQVVSEWICREICPQDAVCANCLVILQDNIQSSNSIRRFGCRNICIPCGSSILRAHHTHAVPIDAAERNIILQWIPPHQVNCLEQVCMRCWLRASRAVNRNRQQDGNRDMEMQPMDVGDSSYIPQPPPMPTPVMPPNAREISTITVTNYKRAASTSRHCIFKTYYTYVLVDTDPSISNTRAAFAGYCCNCLVGRRTVGCCAHVMSVVWYLSWARYQDEVEPPASFLEEVLLVRHDFENDDDDEY